MLRISVVCLLGCLITASGPAGAAERPLAEEFLLTGRLADGDAALRERLKQKPGDDEARFGLGAVQFIRGIERLGQSLYRFGAAPRVPGFLELPFLRLPVPDNPNPEAVTNDKLRKVFSEMLVDLRQAEETLAGIQSADVKCPLKIGKIRLDLNGDGQADADFDTIVSRYLQRQPQAAVAQLDVAFDRGDVAWLRGYCHLLSALLNVALAHDGRELFEHTGHLMFARVESPYIQALGKLPQRGSGFDYESIADLIAFIHLFRLPVIEPDRMRTAHDHLKQVFALSRESWKFILAETDNDREWIPNPKQNGSLGIPIRQDQVDSWLSFVDEVEALLEGKRLVPFWRGGRGERGLNLRRVFSEPREFDLVLWVQGSAAVPYLEEGPQTNQTVWNRLQQVFGGEFLTFGIWFN